MASLLNNKNGHIFVKIFLSWANQKIDFIRSELKQVESKYISENEVVQNEKERPENGHRITEWNQCELNIKNIKKVRHKKRRSIQKTSSPLEGDEGAHCKTSVRYK